MEYWSDGVLGKMRILGFSPSESLDWLNIPD